MLFKGKEALRCWFLLIMILCWTTIGDLLRKDFNMVYEEKVSGIRNYID
jgi:hypothetical protein